MSTPTIALTTPEPPPPVSGEYSIEDIRSAFVLDQHLAFVSATSRPRRPSPGNSWLRYPLSLDTTNQVGTSLRHQNGSPYTVALVGPSNLSPVDLKTLYPWVHSSSFKRNKKLSIWFNSTMIPKSLNKSPLPPSIHAPLADLQVTAQLNQVQCVQFLFPTPFPPAQHVLAFASRLPLLRSQLRPTNLLIHYA